MTTAHPSDSTNDSPDHDAHGYLTTPPPSEHMPPGIPYIIGNEVAERFSFYGMKAILTVFMTKYLVDASGKLAVMSEPDAKSWVHTFVAAAYFFPIIGAIFSDWLFGKYRMIVGLSLIYCLGHVALAADDTRLGLAVGLILIAIGTGAIKPCVSAHVGDQFGPRNAHLMSSVFGWFYWSINLGAFASSLLTPVLLDWKHGGPHLAFAVPGILMGVATLVFWLGRYQFVHVPPRGSQFLQELKSPEVLWALRQLAPIYFCIAAFWCLFDQTSSAWVLQADKMDLNFLGFEWRSSQIQAVNPALILTLAPLFVYVIYPAINQVWRLTPLRKIGLGMFLMVPAFAISGLIERAIQAGATPSIGWQVLAYVPLTAAEVMVSITCLEFSYTQAPKSMKSIVMSFYLLSVSLGNEFTAVVNKVIANSDGTSRLPGESYYWFFTSVMAVAAVAYVFVAINYRGRTFVQGDPNAES